MKINEDVNKFHNELNIIIGKSDDQLIAPHLGCFAAFKRLITCSSKPTPAELRLKEIDKAFKKVLKGTKKSIHDWKKRSILKQSVIQAVEAEFLDGNTCPLGPVIDTVKQINTKYFSGSNTVIQAKLVELQAVQTEMQGMAKLNERRNKFHQFKMQQLKKLDDATLPDGQKLLATIRIITEAQGYLSAVQAAGLVSASMPLDLTAAELTKAFTVMKQSVENLGSKHDICREVFDPNGPVTKLINPIMIGKAAARVVPSADISAHKALADLAEIAFEMEIIESIADIDLSIFKNIPGIKSKNIPQFEAVRSVFSDAANKVNASISDGKATIKAERLLTVATEYQDLEVLKIDTEQELLGIDYSSMSVDDSVDILFQAHSFYGQKETLRDRLVDEGKLSKPEEYVAEKKSVTKKFKQAQKDLYVIYKKIEKQRTLDAKLMKKRLLNPADYDRLMEVIAAKNEVIQPVFSELRTSAYNAVLQATNDSYASVKHLLSDDEKRVLIEIIQNGTQLDNAYTITDIANTVSERFSDSVNAVRMATITLNQMEKKGVDPMGRHHTITIPQLSDLKIFSSNGIPKEDLASIRAIGHRFTTHDFPDLSNSRSTGEHMELAEDIDARTDLRHIQEYEYHQAFIFSENPILNAVTSIQQHMILQVEEANKMMRTIEAENGLSDPSVSAEAIQAFVAKNQEVMLSIGNTDELKSNLTKEAVEVLEATVTLLEEILQDVQAKKIEVEIDIINHRKSTCDAIFNDTDDLVFYTEAQTFINSLKDGAKEIEKQAAILSTKSHDSYKPAKEKLTLLKKYITGVQSSIQVHIQEMIVKHATLSRDNDQYLIDLAAKPQAFSHALQVFSQVTSYNQEMKLFKKFLSKLDGVMTHRYDTATLGTNQAKAISWAEYFQTQVNMLIGKENPSEGVVPFKKQEAILNQLAKEQMTQYMTDHEAYLSKRSQADALGKTKDEAITAQNKTKAVQSHAQKKLQSHKVTLQATSRQIQSSLDEAEALSQKNKEITTEFDCKEITNEFAGFVDYLHSLETDLTAQEALVTFKTIMDTHTPLTRESLGDTEGRAAAAAALKGAFNISQMANIKVHLTNYFKHLNIEAHKNDSYIARQAAQALHAMSSITGEHMQSLQTMYENKILIIQKMDKIAQLVEMTNALKTAMQKAALLVEQKGGELNSIASEIELITLADRAEQELGRQKEAIHNTHRKIAELVMVQDMGQSFSAEDIVHHYDYTEEKVNALASALQTASSVTVKESLAIITSLITEQGFEVISAEREAELKAERAITDAAAIKIANQRKVHGATGSELQTLLEAFYFEKN